MKARHLICTAVARITILPNIGLTTAAESISSVIKLQTQMIIEINSIAVAISQPDESDLKWPDPAEILKIFRSFNVD